MMDCPKILQLKYLKNKIINSRQRYSCKAFNGRYTVIQKSSTREKATKKQALALYLKDLGFKFIERLLKFSNKPLWKPSHP